MNHAIRYIKLLYRLIFCAVCSFGVSLNIIFSAPNVESTLLYFSILCNILCLVLFVVLIFSALFKREAENKGYSIVKGALTVSMLTAFIAMIVLKPTIVDTSWANFDTEIVSTLVHIVCPLMLFADYLLFDKKGQYKAIYTLYWLVLPSCYYIYTLVFSALGGRWHHVLGETSTVPYNFFDTSIYGVGGVAVWVVGFGIAIFLIGLGMCGLDSLLAKTESKLFSKKTSKVK